MCKKDCRNEGYVIQVRCMNFWWMYELLKQIVITNFMSNSFYAVVCAGILDNTFHNIQSPILHNKNELLCVLLVSSDFVSNTLSSKHYITWCCYSSKFFIKKYQTNKTLWGTLMLCCSFRAIWNQVSSIVYIFVYVIYNNITCHVL